MTNKEMDVKIRDAFEAATPNVLGSILADCAKQKRNITVFKPRRTTGWTLRFVTATAAAILAIVLATGLLQKLPPIIPTGPLFTGTDPTTGPTEPDALTRVDWSMNMTWVLKNGTNQGRYPMTVKGLIENRKGIYLKLDIGVEDSFGYRFSISEPDGDIGHDDYFVDRPGDYYVTDLSYSCEKGHHVPTHWAISTTKEYLIIHWPEKPDLFLVGANDPNVTPAEIMAYFDLFVEEFQSKDPEPTDPEPTDPEPTDPEPTEPEPTVPKPEIPDGFPADIDTDVDTVEKFQKLFDGDTVYVSFWNLALSSAYDDPQDADLFTLFYCGFPGEGSGLTTAEIEALKDRGFDTEYDIERMPVDRIEDILNELYGLRLADFPKDALAKYTYLESTNCYYSNHSDGAGLVYLTIVGTRTTKDGNIEVFYSYQRTEKGVVTLKPVGDSYHILSNYYSEDGTWPGEEVEKPIDPDILAQFPKDLITDPAILAKMENLLAAREGEINYYNQALLSFYDIVYDVDFEKLFYNTIPGQEPITAEEKAALKAMGFHVDQPIQRIPLEELEFGLPFRTFYTYFMSDWMERYPYISTMSAFYFNHTDELRAEDLHVVGVRYQGDVTQVYYVYNGDVAGVVTLCDNDIFANHRLGTEPELKKPEISAPFPQDLKAEGDYFRHYAQWFAYEGSWFKYALSQTYNSYQELSLAQLFSHGFADEHPITAAELAALQLSEQEQKYPGVRLPVDKMKKVMKRTFGVPLSYMPEEAFAGLHYLEETDCYYYFGEQAKALETIQVIGYRSGSNDFYYLDTATGIMGVVRVGHGTHSLTASRNGYYENGAWPEFKNVNQPPKYDVQIPDDLSTDAAVMDRLNELFAYERNTPMSIWRMAVATRFEDPRNIELSEFFYNGVGNYSPGDYRVTWEERCQLRDEHGFMFDVDMERLPPEEMNKVLIELFGITLDDVGPKSFQGLAYMESTGYYYNNHSDAIWYEVLEILGYRMMDDGSMEVYYYSDCHYPDVQGVITLQPHGDSYRILSNIYSDKK